jgi:hypothetical protein
MRRLMLLLALFLLPFGCATFPTGSAEPVGPPPTPGAYALFDEVPPIPSEILAEREQREDLHIRTMTGHPIPAVIATAETPPLVVAPGMRVSLAGDAHGTMGWSVNNFVLFEVLVEGEIVDRFTVGYHEPVHRDAEMVESVGTYSLNFDARSPIISQRLPTNRPFVLRATALDYRTAGSVTEVWLLVEEDDGASEYRDLRDD